MLPRGKKSFMDRNLKKHKACIYKKLDDVLYLVTIHYCHYRNNKYMNKDYGDFIEYFATY